MKKKISAVIITNNEEKNIERCIKSLDFIDEILILDSGSTDKTLEICSKYKCKVIENEWLGFGPTKKMAVDNASYDWILSIDADEVVSEELKNELIELLESTHYNAFNIKRKSFYLGKLINHCGWASDYPLRLFDRRYGNFNEKPVHESVIVKCERGRIESPLYHFTYPTIGSHISKINRYTDLSAAELIKEGKQYSIFASLFFGFNKFLKMYFLKLGFLDGKEGLILCINSAYGIYLKYIKTWKRK